MPRSKAVKITNKRGTSNLDIELGGRLRALRLDRGLSQEQLGVQLGVSFQQIQKYEKGSNRLSVNRARQVASALKTSMTELIGDGAAADGGKLFDTESYKLAREFSRLPDRLKSKFRSLIASIVEDG